VDACFSPSDRPGWQRSSGSSGRDDLSALARVCLLNVFLFFLQISGRKRD
jgi:hypothetical protein